MQQRAETAMPASAWPQLKYILRQGFAYLDERKFLSAYAALLILLLVAVGSGMRFLMQGIPALYFMIATAIFLAGLWQWIIWASLHEYKNFIHFLASAPVQHVRSFFYLVTASAILAVFMLPILLLIIHIPAIGMILATIPIILFLTYTSYVPLIILQRNATPWRAILQSYRLVKRSKMEETAVIFSLAAINFLAFVFLVFPLIITLPVTALGMALLFDLRYTR